MAQQLYSIVRTSSDLLSISSNISLLCFEKYCPSVVELRTVLESCKSLFMISIKNAMIDNSNALLLIEVLRCYPKIQHISFSNNNISDMQIFANWNLFYLNLSNNNLDKLDGAFNVKCLSVSNTQIPRESIILQKDMLYINYQKNNFFYNQDVVNQYQREHGLDITRLHPIILEFLIANSDALQNPSIKKIMQENAKSVISALQNRVRMLDLLSTDDSETDAVMSAEDKGSVELHQANSSTVESDDDWSDLGSDGSDLDDEWFEVDISGADSKNEE